MQALCRLGLKAFGQELFLHKSFKRFWLMQFNVHVVCVPNTTRRYTVRSPKRQLRGTAVQLCVAFHNNSTAPKNGKVACLHFKINSQILFALLLSIAGNVLLLHFSVQRACLCVCCALLHIHNRMQRADNSQRTFSIRHRQPSKWWFPTLRQGL